jgi:hypothetical protein
MMVAVRSLSRLALSLVLSTALIAAPPPNPLESISAQSMRGHLSFLASDLLEGRSTPSRGLDIAAEYIGAQFRRAGLKPAGDDGYFQTAKMVSRETDPAQWKLRVNGIELSAEEVSGRISVPVDAKDIAIVKVTKDDALPDVAGKLVLTCPATSEQVFRKLRDMKPVAIALVAEKATTGRPPMRPQLVDPGAPAQTPIFSIGSPQLFKEFESMPEGETAAKASIHVPAPKETPVVLHNVIGVLPGTDPALKDTYVIVSAHYDHLPPAATGDDRIYNGANDDGSGTVSVIEIASALARMNPRPKRSIAFVTFFGEELGLVGSEYYAAHPALPIEKTVAQINLEQVGRTDDTRGPQVNRAALTGFDYSDVGSIMEAAADKLGITIYHPGKYSDMFFSQSDNLPLARLGVPAHTVGVSFEFPDYHRPGDEWQKIDYDNMARVDRAVAAGLLAIADNPVAPKWNKENPKAEPYFKARP